MSSFRTEVLADAETLARHAAEWVVERARAGTEAFALCLSGGSTPKRLYELLAQKPLIERMPWERVHLFFGDERFVPRDHPDSNYRMADQAMIAHVPIPPENVHGMPVDGTPEEAAQRYEHLLQAMYGSSEFDPARPLFDVTLLGLGEDGHTASLFPGTPVLHERQAWAAAVIGAKPEPRLTLTFPALNASRAAAFLIAGAAKQAMLERLQARDPALPASHVSPQGELVYLTDRAAAGTP
jgi:6-phosphogluconolactonase